MLVVGYWLPCGEANFFRSEDRSLLDDNEPLTNYQAAANKVGVTRRLEASTSRRLIETLGSLGYLTFRWQPHPEASEPSAVAFHAPQPWITGQHPLDALADTVLLANS